MNAMQRHLNTRGGVNAQAVVGGPMQGRAAAAAAAGCRMGARTQRIRVAPIMATAAEQETQDRGKIIKKMKGKVVSTKMDKTVVVRVSRTYPHPKYGKRMTKSKNFYAHDENNECNEGDIVVVENSRPLSKLKRFTVKDIVEKSKIKGEASE